MDESSVLPVLADPLFLWAYKEEAHSSHVVASPGSATLLQQFYKVDQLVLWSF